MARGSYTNFRTLPLHDELSEDYRDMIYAGIVAEIETRRRTFLRKGDSNVGPSLIA